MRKTGFVLLWMVSGYLFAQEKPGIVTDRPSQSATSSLVPKGSLQVETGLVLENDDAFDGFNFNTLVRWGLAEHFEFRFRQDYLGTSTGTESSNGLGPVRLGFKSFVTKEKGWAPEAAFIGNITLPSGESVYQSQNTTPDFRFAVSKTLSDRFSIGYNLGMQWDDDSPRSTTFYTLVLSGSFAGKFGWFVEPYGFIRKDERPGSSVNGGIAYLIKSNMQVDVSGGFGLTDKSPDNFISFGYSVNFQ